jgi:uncharacterized delta-60 repeat protein
LRRTLVLGLVLLALGPAAAAGDGGPVRSFGAGGAVSFAPQRFSSGAGVVVDAQGRTLVGATLDDGSLLRTRAAVLRLLPGGGLDPSFGSGGVATIAPPAPYATTRSEAIALDPQGRIVIAGEVDDAVPAVARLLADGTLDPAFAAGGLLIARGAYGGLPGGWKSVAVAGPSIVLAGAVDGAPPFGTSPGRIAVVARITDSGLPDAAFAAGGFLQVPIDGVTFASTHAVAIDRRGRIVLGIWRATTAAFPGDVAAAVVRITAAGRLDGTFGSGGLVVLGPLQGHAPAVSVTGTGAILAVGGWSAPTSAVVIAARLQPSGRLDTSFGANGLLSGDASPAAGVLDCHGDVLLAGGDGIRRFGPDGRLDRTFRGAGVPRVAVGATSAAFAPDSLALAPDGSLVLSGTASDGPITIGGSTQTGATSVAVARMLARCPVVDSTRPTVTLTCSAGCARVTGAALDDPVGHGVRHVLLGIERIAGSACEAWNGRRLARVACARAAARLVAEPLLRGAFLTPPLGAGRFVVRAVAIDGAGNRSRIAVRSVRRQ